MNKKNLFIAVAGIFLLAVFSLSLLNPAPARASFSGTDYQQIFENNVFGDDEVNQPSFGNETTMATIASLNNMILGCATEACKEKLGANAGGAVGTVGNLIASLYATPPASSAYYLADLGQRLNLTQPAYAQGIGFRGLNPLLDLWKAARNVAYTFFIFVFLIIGFAIMFRAKINPQTVVTIQSAIPKAVVALILVTFSYAIAGLMIDLMYLVIGLGGGILASSGLIENNLLNEYVNIGFFGVIKKVIGGDIDAAWELANGVWGGIIGGEGLLAGASRAVASFLSTVIVALIVGVALLFTIFKLFLALLMAYIQIIISIIIAPFQLMLSAIPGQNTFGSWLRNLAQNLLAFPAVILAFALGEALVKLPAKNLWAPPLLGGGTISSDVLTSVLSLGILLLTAKIPDIIKSMFEKKPFAAGAALGEPLKVGAGAVITGGKRAYESLPRVQEGRAKKEALLKGKGEHQAAKELAEWKAKHPNY